MSGNACGRATRSLIACAAIVCCERFVLMERTSCTARTLDRIAVSCGVVEHDHVEVRLIYRLKIRRASRRGLCLAIRLSGARPAARVDGAADEDVGALDRIRTGRHVRDCAPKAVLVVRENRREEVTDAALDSNLCVRLRRVVVIDLQPEGNDWEIQAVVQLHREPSNRRREAQGGVHEEGVHFGGKSMSKKSEVRTNFLIRITPRSSGFTSLTQISKLQACRLLRLLHSL